jgi:chromosome segregation ATPase
MVNWTICGYCNERVPCEGSGVIAKPHNCEVLKDVKKKVDLALSDIQKDYNHKLQEINGTLRNHRSLNAHLENEIAKLKKELSTCIDVKLLYSDRQARETWQTGVEVMIDTLHKRISDMDFMLKNSLLCVDNSHADENANRLGLAPVAHLNKIAKEQLKGTNPKGIVFHEFNHIFPIDVCDKIIPKIHHPSRKHLENKLHEKNIEIKEHKDQIIRLEKLLGEAITQRQKREFEIDTLKSNRAVLLDQIDKLQEENKTLREGLDAIQQFQKIINKGE